MSNDESNNRTAVERARKKPVSKWSTVMAMIYLWVGIPSLFPMLYGTVFLGGAIVNSSATGSGKSDDDDTV